MKKLELFLLILKLNLLKVILKCGDYLYETLYMRRRY